MRVPIFYLSMIRIKSLQGLSLTPKRLRLRCAAKNTVAFEDKPFDPSEAESKVTLEQLEVKDGTVRSAMNPG